MRFLLATAALFLAACGQSATTTTTSSETTVSTTTETSAANTPANAWFICDGLDQPKVLVFTGGPPAHTTEMQQYDKPTGASHGAPVVYHLGEGDGAAGSIYIPLQLNGQDAGHIRMTNSGMLENPGSAYTERYTEVQLGDETTRCRWTPRTRFVGVTGRRTIVIHEDQDGDLIYSTYDFAKQSAPIDVAENGQTSTFSAEARGGTEQSKPPGVEFDFAKNGYRYVVNADTGSAQIQVFQGTRLIQTENAVAVQFGTAAHGTTP